MKAMDLTGVKCIVSFNGQKEEIHFSHIKERLT